MSISGLNNANVPGNFAKTNIFFVSLNIYLTHYNSSAFLCKKVIFKLKQVSESIIKLL